MHRRHFLVKMYRGEDLIDFNLKKTIEQHLMQGTMNLGEEIGLWIRQTFTQDAT